MSRKNAIFSYNFFDSQTVNADATSNLTSSIMQDQATIAVVWSASTLVADLIVQVRNGSNDAWRNLDFGSPIAIAGASGTHEIHFLSMPWTDMRLFLDVASGSGVVDATLTAKAVGA
jgi:hypothetical protein